MTPELFYGLIDNFGSATEAWGASKENIENIKGFGPAVREKFLDLRDREDGSQELERAAEIGCRIVTLPEPEYPESLRRTPAPAPALYIKGELKESDKWAIAIVGTRKCSGYGRDMAFNLARELAAQGFTIVSGLAKGIDASAHKGALAAGGRTIAVFGTPVNVVYPPAHHELALEVFSRGALISEFPLGMKPEAWFFPRRNRVVSGLSRGVVVVQAPEKSGAMITAGIAVEQDRKVFAVPGDVNVEASRGPHWLLKYGAHLVESAEDVVNILGSPRGQVELELDLVSEPVEPTQARVLSGIKDTPILFDELCAAVKLPAREVSPALMMLEMMGHVRQLPGKMYVRI